MKKNVKKGFSMMEAMVGVFILSMGLIGMMMTVSKSIKYSIDSRNQTIAVGLAQGGIEIMRNIRDDNLAMGLPAFKGIDDSTSPNGSRSISAGNYRFYVVWRGNDVNGDQRVLSKAYLKSPTTPTQNLATENYPYTLRYSESEHWYYSSQSASSINELTRFSQRINIQEIDPNTREVTSIVSWKGSDIYPPDPASCNVSSQCVFVKETLVNY